MVKKDGLGVKFLNKVAFLPKKGGNQMKSSLVKCGVVFLIAIIFCPYSSFAEIIIKYDRFKNITVIQIDPSKTVGTSNSPALTLFGYYNGEMPSRPAICSLGFVARSPSWTFLRCHDLSCLADGKPIQLPASKHSGDIGRGSVSEHVSVMIPFSIIEQLSKCEKLEFQLCSVEFSLSRNEMEDLRAFVEAFSEKK